MVSFVVQYQGPLTFSYKAVLNGGLSVGIGGVDVLDTDVPLAHFTYTEKEREQRQV